MKYVFPLLGWYLDLLVYLTISFLGRVLLAPDLEWSFFADLAVFILVRLIAMKVTTTPGEWLMAPAALERLQLMTNRPRQWPNLLAGTLLFLEGTKSTVRWLEMDHPIPFMGYLPEGAAQGLLGIGMGLFFAVSGIALLRLEPIGRILGFLVVGVTAVSTALSWGLWDTVIARMVVARRAAQGIRVGGDEIEFMQALFPESIVVGIIALSGLLLVCRSSNS